MNTVTLPKKFAPQLKNIHRLAKDKLGLSSLLLTQEGLTYMGPYHEIFCFRFHFPMEVEGEVTVPLRFPPKDLIDALLQEPHTEKLRLKRESITLLDDRGKIIKTLSVKDPLGSSWKDEWVWRTNLPLTLMEGAFREVERFIATDETRDHMNRAHMEITTGKLTVVGTNGHILAIYEGFSPFVEVPAPIQIGLPLQMKSFFPHLQGEVEVLEHKDNGTEDVQHYLYRSNKMEVRVSARTKYPPYGQIIPRENNPEDKISVDSALFKDVVEHLYLLRKDSPDPRTFQILLKTEEGRLCFSCVNSTFRTSIPATSGHLHTALSCDYLKTACDLVSKSVTIDIYQDRSDTIDPSLNPILFRTVGEEWYQSTAVVMPVRV